ncbi:thaumatin-like protein 1b, partial [Zingiber officinale]|uniref:thaumatin-like protein 1b n=1 Tax=Zingiber officinale TaxID=94328 RepID=UPI001C4DD8A9
VAAVLSTTFTVINNCGYDVWPGVLANAGSSALDSTGFALAPGESRALFAPLPWSGRLWARTLCSADSSSGRFVCATGDCGSGAVACGGAGAVPPATLAEFTLGGAGTTDFYDVSLVDGFNLPVLVAPLGGAGAGCAATWCAADVNAVCPPELRVAAAGSAAVACKSACGAFGTARYCCSEEFGSPAACGPTPYSELFKTACPRAYSYAYDDASSTFTCPTAAVPGGGYAVTFCPETTSLEPKGGDRNPEATGLPSANGTMVFFGSANSAAGDVPYLHQFGGVFALPKRRSPLIPSSVSLVLVARSMGVSDASGVDPLTNR